MTSGDEIVPGSFPEELVEESRGGVTLRDVIDVHTDEDASDLKSIISENERDLIMKTLISNKYNKSKTANALNIDRKTLYKKIRKYNLDS